MVTIRELVTLAILQRSNGLKVKEVQKQLTKRGTRVEYGSLVTYLCRLHKKKLLKRSTDEDKFTVYSLSAVGKRQLEKHRKSIA